MKRNATVLVGIACGLVCATCVYLYLQGATTRADAQQAETLARYGGEQVEVCVAKRDIAAGEVLDPGAVETRLWVASLLPEGAIRDIAQVKGEKVSSSVFAGEVLVKRRLNEQDSALDIPPGLSAVSVPAKDVQAVGGAVSAGVRTDIYATGGSTTSLLVHDVLVLATNSGTSESRSKANTSWITIAVKPDLVQEIVAAAQKSELYFSLPGDTSSASAQGSETHTKSMSSVSNKERR